MIKDYADYIIHIKSGGGKTKYYKCCCDVCEKDRGYLPKASEKGKCRKCLYSDKDFIKRMSEAIKKVRSTDESREKTRKQVKTHFNQPVFIQKREEKLRLKEIRRNLASTNPGWWRTKEWKEKISNTLKGNVPWNKGNTSQLHKKLRHNISSAIQVKIKRRGIRAKGKKFFKLGYSISELMAHIESLWQPGMNWENHGRGPNCWHIDHKIPDSWFNYSSVDDESFKECWALENLQPLWEKDNLSKSNRYSD